MNNSDRNRLALMLLNDGSGSLSRRSAVSNAFESAVGVDPTQAEFLRSEKDTRPYWETDHRATVMPLIMSGYNNSVGYGAPMMLGGNMWSVLGDILGGRQTSPEERKSAAWDAAGMAMTGALAAGAAPAGALRSGAMRSEAAKAGTPKNESARSLDPLGYYSRALEEAKTLPAKASPDQVLATLKNKGVKPGEIEATGLAEFLQGKPSVTRDNVVGHLTDNRVGLNEVTRGATPDILEAEAQRNFGRSYHELSPRDQRDIGDMLNNSAERTKWSKYSLDPSNPTYRETVLHLPETDSKFTSGHFPERNIVGHYQSSINQHNGRPVFTLDQLQSDWGQKLRDGGVRDEAKAARLAKEIKDKFGDMSEAARTPGHPQSNSDFALMERRKLAPERRAEFQRLTAEWNDAQNGAVGHPLVNTTDQWTSTVLRRAVRNAIDENADHIAIPSGDTVLSYNPGDTHGMNAFYNDIVPKNLAKILGGLDRNGVSRTIVDQLQTPSGMKGNGFTVFDITPEMRQAAIKGMPLFANHPAASLAALLAHADRDQP